MVEKITVSILCCTRLLRESIAHMLEKKGDFQVVAARPPGPVGMGEVDPSAGRVIVFDSLQSFISESESARRTNSASHNGKAVLVAMEDNEDHFLKAVQSGARGYVLQEASIVDIATAIRSVARGEVICPFHMISALFDDVASRAMPSGKSTRYERRYLSPREHQLLSLIDRGLTNKEIASELNLSEQTVKNHVHNMLRKARVANRQRILEAVQYAPVGDRGSTI